MVVFLIGNASDICFYNKIWWPKAFPSNWWIFCFFLPHMLVIGGFTVTLNISVLYYALLMSSIIESSLQSILDFDILASLWSIYLIYTSVPLSVGIYEYIDVEEIHGFHFSFSLITYLPQSGMHFFYFPYVRGLLLCSFIWGETSR